MIPPDMLFQNGATVKKYKKGQSIFFEGDIPSYYFQIAKGSIKMVSVNDLGKEFIQGIFKTGNSFREPILLIDKPYPATAVANEDSTIIKLNKDIFLNILKEKPELLFGFSQVLAKRIYNKSLIAKEISTYGPEHRLFSVLKIFKEDPGLDTEVYKIELSRQ